MDWEEIKKEFRVKTSEELFYISPQPSNQCPSFDTICRAVSEIESATNVSRGDNRDEEERLSDIEYEVRGLEGSINDVRDNVELIRNWGQEWKDLAKRIIEKYNIDIKEL